MCGAGGRSGSVAVKRVDVGGVGGLDVFAKDNGAIVGTVRLMCDEFGDEFVDEDAEPVDEVG